MANAKDLVRSGRWAADAAAHASTSVVSGAGATRTLTQEESGSLVLFDRAAGTVFTLPKPVVGTYFDFLVTAAITSNAAKVITDAASTFLVGALQVYTLATAAAAGVAADGTTHRALSSNGSTTGGLVGSKFRVTCISPTQWAITGDLVGSGVVATPFATS